MSLVIVPGDDNENYIDITSDSFTKINYWHDLEATELSSRMQGAYRKLTKYKMFLDTESQEFFNYLLEIKADVSSWLYSFIYTPEESRLNGTYEILSVIVEPNPDYDPSTYEKEFNDRLKLLEDMKHEGVNVW